MSKVNEIWLPVKGYEGIYEVSNLGRIKSLPQPFKVKGKYLRISKEIIRQGSDNGRGYLSISLYNNGKEKRHYIHRLVAIAFIHNANNLKYVNHIDGNKKNNNLENLEWITCSDNILHDYKLGTRKYGEDAANSRFTNEQAKEMKALRETNLSYAKIGKIFGTSGSHVFQICKGIIFYKAI